jgi:hypothetical protein
VHLGPVESPYPGKYVCFAMAAFCATLAWRSSRIAVQTAKDQRKNAAQGVLFKPDAKRNMGANVAVALVTTLLLATMLAAISTAWPN